MPQITTHFLLSKAPPSKWQIISSLGQGRKKPKWQMVNTGLCFGWFSHTDFPLVILLNGNQGVTPQWLLLSRNNNCNSFSQGTVVSLILCKGSWEKNISLPFYFFLKFILNRKKVHERLFWQSASRSKSIFFLIYKHICKRKMNYFQKHFKIYTFCSCL